MASSRSGMWYASRPKASSRRAKEAFLAENLALLPCWRKKEREIEAPPSSYFHLPVQLCSYGTGCSSPTRPSASAAQQQQQRARFFRKGKEGEREKKVCHPHLPSRNVGQRYKTDRAPDHLRLFPRVFARYWSSSRPALLRSFSPAQFDLDGAFSLIRRWMCEIPARTIFNPS